MFKKILIIIILFFLLLPSATSAVEVVEINFFHSQTCPFCLAEKEFLNKLGREFPQITINSYDVAQSSTVEKLEGFYNKYKVPSENWGLIPATFVGGQAYLGFTDETGTVIRSQIIKLLNDQDSDWGMEVSQGTFEQQVSDQLAILKQRKIKIPFFGEFQVAGFSPLALSSAVGILDGFNACALVALSILLAILISTGNRRRVIMVGGTFILVSGLVYYIFIAAWLNVFLFLGYLKIITYLISLLVIIFGLFLLKDYFYDIVCKICDIKNDNQNGLLTRAQRYLFAKANRTVSSEMPLVLMLLIVDLYQWQLKLLSITLKPRASLKKLSYWLWQTNTFALWLAIRFGCHF